ncbi:helix-turn-helix domain-containing protein [Halococcus sp. PRR34]|uniref:helix-turn-helix domain-containing protein n=1 Tax=Halococcus sp. PRR34 TaxID=3020830 RepID=UPI00236105C9|nr:helix-turn-helix domain-containing protein [Halococcus sp. PRR34]
MTSAESNEMLRLTLKLWHPNCWTIEVTERTDAGLLGHGAYTADTGVANGRFTVYADDEKSVDNLITATRASSLTGSVEEIRQSFGSQSSSATAPGNTVREVFVEYDAKNSIDEAFVSRGFIYDGPTNISDGYEEWSLITHHNRETVQELLTDVRQENDAEIEVTRVTQSHRTNDADTALTSVLSERQREMFEFARENGYYQWPRAVSARELASELDITKTTFLEHLRKAEAKLLSDI